jgi:hypothetical protein
VPWDTSLPRKLIDSCRRLLLPPSRGISRLGEGESSIVTDGLRAYSAAMNEIGVAERHEVGGRLNNRAENSHSRFGDANGRCSAFEVRRRCRSSAQFMPRCTTNSIRSAISSRGKSTSKDALLPWPSGALSRHRSPLARWRSHCISTSLRYFDTAVASRPFSLSRSRQPAQRRLAIVLQTTLMLSLTSAAAQS